MKTNAEIAKALKGFYETQIVSLNGILEKLPEALRPDMLKIKEALDEQLKKLGPIDQVPAAQDAGWALMSLSDAVTRANDLVSNLMARITAISTDLSTRTLSLNAMEDKLTKKELLTKDEAKTLADAARTEGAKSVLPQIIALRKGQVELAGLPTATDEILGGEDFQVRFDACKANVAALSAKGLKLGGKGEKLVKDTAWLTATEFAGRLETFSDIIGAPAAAAPKDEKKVEPLMQPAAGADKGKKGPRAGLL